MWGLWGKSIRKASGGVLQGSEWEWGVGGEAILVGDKTRR